jgi:Rod binding domain-containing protein
MTIDHVTSIQNVAPLRAVPELPDKASAEGQKIKTFAREFEAVFIGKLLDEMSASVDSLNEEKDGAAKQIDGIFRMELAENLSKNGSLGLAKSLEQYVSQTLSQTQTGEDTRGQVL